MVHFQPAVTVLNFSIEQLMTLVNVRNVTQTNI